MNTIIRFGKPYDVTRSGLDGTQIAFPFTVTRPGVGARRDAVIEHRVIVDISGTRSTIWGFGRHPDTAAEIAPTLFEYARPAVFEALVDGTLNEDESVRTSIPDTGQYPFDPAKLTQPDGATYEIDLDEAKRQRQLGQRGPIGFRFPDQDA